MRLEGKSLGVGLGTKITLQSEESRNFLYFVENKLDN
jgi:hypothetical protein